MNWLLKANISWKTRNEERDQDIRVAIQDCQTNQCFKVLEERSYSVMRATKQSL